MYFRNIRIYKMDIAYYEGVEFTRLGDKWLISGIKTGDSPFNAELKLWLESLTDAERASYLALLRRVLVSIT